MANINAKRSVGFHIILLICISLQGRRKRRFDDNSQDIEFLNLFLSYIFLLNEQFLKPRYFQPRRQLWLDTRAHTFWTDIVRGSWLFDPLRINQRYKNQFRMTHGQFEKLVKMLAPFIKKQDTKFRDAITVEKKLGIVLHRLCQGGSTYRVGNHFGVSAATMTIFTIDVCKVLIHQFYNTYIKIPDDETLQEIMNGFETLTGIPYMWGAIDGTHIRLLRKPKQEYNLADYHNRLGYYSILLQRVCDHRRKFLNVCVRAPRGSHDAAHLRGSTLWQKLQSGELPSHNHQFKLFNKDIYPYLIGDSAYPLQKGLMK